jgi:transposase
VPGSTILSIPEHEQEQMRAQLRRARYGYLLAVHVLLLCAAGRTPTEIATFLFCSRSSVYRIVNSYRDGTLKFERFENGSIGPPIRTTYLAPTYRRSLLALLGKAPSIYGWCRTRWSCQTLAAQLKIQRGLEVSASTLRRWLHELDYVWKRAKLVARDDDPERVERLARIRHKVETLGKKAILLFADELDIHLLPKVGYEWMPKGEVRELVTPGQNRKRYLAGSLDPKTGRIYQVTGERKTNALFRALLEKLDWTYPAADFEKVYVVVDNYGIHKAKAVGTWLASHPRFELLFLPTYCPKANPIERCFGDVHDKCTRNHRRRRIEDLVLDVERHFEVNGPWSYKLSDIYYTPEITAAVQRMSAEKKSEVAA